MMSERPVDPSPDEDKSNYVFVVPSVARMHLSFSGKEGSIYSFSTNEILRWLYKDTGKDASRITSFSANLSFSSSSVVCDFESIVETISSIQNGLKSSFGPSFGGNPPANEVLSFQFVFLDKSGVILSPGILDRVFFKFPCIKVGDKQQWHPEVPTTVNWNGNPDDIAQIRLEHVPVGKLRWC